MRKLTKAVSTLLAVVMLMGIVLCAPFTVSATEQEECGKNTVEEITATTQQETSISDAEAMLSQTTSIFKEAEVKLLQNYTSVESVEKSKKYISGDYTYTLSYNDEATIIKYDGEDTNLIIPEILDGKLVVAIGNKAFGSPNITSITIPKTLTKVEYSTYYKYTAFGECENLKTIIIEDGMETIPAGLACLVTSLENVVIPKSVTKIERDAFYECSNLTNIELPSDLEAIDAEAFEYSGLKFITFPNKFTTIGFRAFGNCKNLETVNFSDSIKEIDEFAFYNCKSIQKIELPHYLEKIGNKAFGSPNITSITIPKTLTKVEYSTYYKYTAFGECENLKTIIIEDGMETIPAGLACLVTSLENVVIPKSVTKIERDAFYECSNLTIYGYENSFAEEYALDNNISFIAIAEDETFIQKHLEFIGAEKDNNTYHNLLTHCDLSQNALEDYKDLEDTYNLWKAVRGEIFENPYYVVLADMIMGEGSAQGQLESFDVNLDSNWRSITNDIMGLINSKVELTPSQESKIKKMFKNKDFSDETTFKLLEDILKSKVSQDELNSIFNVYDKTNTFIDIFNKGANIVNSIVDTINYSAILKSYKDTSDEFKVVLMQISYSCKIENPWLYTAIDKYLNSDYDTEMRNKIIGEVAKNGLDIGETLFKDAIVNKVKNFLINNMDLSKVGTKVASSVLAFVQGAEIGKSIGIGIDNILFNTDDVTNSYVTASATAKTAEYLKFVLENNESALRNNPTIKNTSLFCETFSMYKNVQLNVADTMITYFSKNQIALINKIFKSNNAVYENQIYNWQILKLNWQNASCHNGYILKSSVKNMTVACPVNIAIYNQSGNTVLQIVNNEVVYNSGEIVATVCNNIKYITLPDDSYNVKIIAIDDGVMSYSVSNFNVFEDMSKTIHFDNIRISKGKEYLGEIISGKEFKQSDVALYSNNEIVDSEISIYTNENKIEVSNIELNSSSLSLAVGETDTISFTVTPQNASNKSVTWYSENPEIAQVDEYGNVTGVSAGITSIACVSLNGNIKSVCDVSVNNKNILGDVNGDGKITIIDVTLVQRCVVGITSFDYETFKIADVNKDGKISILDVTLILKVVVGLLESL